MKISKNKKNIIQGDALEMIQHGRFGPISVGSSLSDVKDFLSQIEGLQPDHLSTYDSDAEDTWAFAFSSLRFYLNKKHHDEFKVSAIVVDATTKEDSSLDYENHIYFRCHGLRRGNRLKTIRRKLNDMGIDIIDQKTIAYSVELHTNRYGVLSFQFYPPEGIMEETATFSQFIIK
ncbi:hypothetical protein [Ancylobacter aquaticus]|uniref:hypothetical protein n=1 Tax=Ancylobacter aquaticus TaxID=100 RepID=UPI00104C528B|nr:hypothetical protein [Ancylobacter aquaticus]